jgi:hypothetical protein
VREQKLAGDGKNGVYLIDALDEFLSLHEECFTSIEAFNGMILGVNLLILVSQQLYTAVFWSGTK